MGDTKAKREAVRALRKHRDEADEELDEAVVRPVRKTYEKEVGVLMMLLARGHKGETREDIRPPHLQRTMRFLQAQMATVGDALTTALNGYTARTFANGIKSTATVVERMVKSGTPLSDAKVITKMVGKRQATLNTMRARSGVALTNSLNKGIIKRLQNLPTEGARVGDLISKVGEGLDEDWWKVERTIRTETSFAYNQAQGDGIIVLAKQPAFHGKLYSRWTEFVDDFSGLPLDSRVGEDSIHLHGQVTRPGGSFTMPPGGVGKSAAKMAGMSWTQPPNRPNDRAVLTPWMKAWGIPGYIMLAGTRTPL